jgi:hypothetical protein
MRSTIAAIILCSVLFVTFIFVLGQTRPAHSPDSPGLRLVSTLYSSGSIPIDLRSKVGIWLVSHFEYVLGAHWDLPTAGTSVVAAGYQDGSGAYVPEIYSWVHEVAAQNRFPKYEDMLLHINQDYAAGPNLSWANLDQFDYFEQTSWRQSGRGQPTMAVHGVFTESHLSYQDVTVSLYNNKETTKIPDKLLLGYAEPFDLVNVTVAKGGAGGSVIWQYWNGSTWATLPTRSDSSDGLTTSGAIQFTPPADWIPTVQHGSLSKYWVRLTVSGATSPPVLARVYGDDWTSHAGANNCRGWSATDPHRINIGLGNLEYNPTPPANATARFRYQARATGFWARNYVFANLSNRQNGQLTWIATILTAWAAGERANGLHREAIYIDDVGAAPPIKPTFTEKLTDDLPPGTTWAQDLLTFYSDVRTAIKTRYGTSFKVGGNAGNDALALLLDFSTHELSFASWMNGGMINSGFASMDKFLAANNPNNSKSSFAGWDNQRFGIKGNHDGVPHLWDGANRSPMVILATYYIGSNPNTMLQYNTMGWSYFDTDEYYYWSAAATTLSAPLNADSSAASKMISLTNGKAFIVPGGTIWRNTANAVTANQAAGIYGYALRIGSDVVKGFKDTDTSFHTFTPILNSYPTGTVVQFAQMGHQAVDPIPDWHNVWYWANYFPAMSVDVGVPDPNGWKGGARDLAYIKPPASSGNPAGCVVTAGCSEIWRRDFTNAIILVKVIRDNTYGFELDTYSPDIQLGETYYPLYSDGTTGNGITQVRLRAGEAAILMKSPNPARR